MNEQPNTGLKCPKCEYTGDEPGENGDGFRLLTDQTVWREIVDPAGTTEDDKILVTAKGPSDHYNEDEEKNERIECRNCLTEFPVPEHITVNYQ